MGRTWPPSTPEPRNPSGGGGLGVSGPSARFFLRVPAPPRSPPLPPEARTGPASSGCLINAGSRVLGVLRGLRSNEMEKGGGLDLPCLSFPICRTGAEVTEPGPGHGRIPGPVPKMPPRAWGWRPALMKPDLPSAAVCPSVRSPGRADTWSSPQPEDRAGPAGPLLLLSCL